MAYLSEIDGHVSCLGLHVISANATERFCYARDRNSVWTSSPRKRDRDRGFVFRVTIRCLRTNGAGKRGVQSPVVTKIGGNESVNISDASRHEYARGEQGKNKQLSKWVLDESSGKFCHAQSSL